MQALDQARGSSNDRGYDYRYRQLAAKVMARHLATFGRICPGWGIDAHPVEKLSVDHIRWPAESEEDLQILCPGCQNRKGAAR